MALSYESTRGGQKGVTASQAILKRLAEDGGLPSGADLPGGFVEIHPFQGKKKDAEGIFGCDR
mgnify:CR=1 FL=1